MKKLMLGLLAAFAVTAEAEIVKDYGDIGNGLTATLDDQGVLTIIGSGDMSNWKYSGAAPWASDSSLVKSVVGENVTSVGSFAFIGLGGIKSVSFPKVTAIGNFAFQDCSSLAEVSLPSAVSVGNSAFQMSDYGGTALVSLSLPKAVTIGQGAFNGCSLMEEITLPSATTIGYHAFWRCSKLSEISLSSATSIGSGAFYECSSLKTLTVKNYAMKTALEGDRSGYGLDESVTVVNASAVTVGDFSYEFDADNHTAMILGYEGSPATVDLDTIEYQQATFAITSVGRYAFDGCSSLIEIALPKVASVGDGAFRGCSALTQIGISEEMVEPLKNNRSKYGIGDDVKIVAIPKLTKAEVENADWEVKEAVVKVEYDITPSSVTLKSGEKTLDQDKYAYACEYYGVEVKQKPDTPDTPSADDFKVVGKDAPIVEPDEIAVKKESIQAPSAGTVTVENNKVQLGVTVLKTDDLTAEKKTWDKVKITKDNIDVDADGNIIVNVPVDSASGFMILQSKDAKIETAE